MIRPDIYDPVLNRSYAELAQHYGCLIDPARGGKPKDKPRVERPMPYVRDSMWRGRDWLGLSDMTTGALVWCTDVAGVRSHRSLDGASPLQVFRALEQPAGCVVPPVVTTTTPSDSLSATMPFPGVTGYGQVRSRPHRTGPRRASPVPTTTF